MPIFNSPRTAQFWTRSVSAGSAWNGDLTAVPGVQGGVSFGDAADAAMADPNRGLYLIGQGSGDGELVMNFGRNPFDGEVPTGFFPGWPYGGAYGVWDAASAQGSALYISEDIVHFPSFPGLIQTVNAQRFGLFYLEYNVIHDIFTTFTGAGIGRNAPDLNYWLANGGFNSVDNNGGAVVIGGSIANGWQASLGSQAVAEVPAPGLFAQTLTDTIALAISISPTVAFRPASYNPVRLPTGYCCPVTLDPRWNKYVM